MEKEGLYVPYAIWYRKDLSLQQKIAYSEIKKYATNSKSYVTNDHLSEVLHLSQPRVSQLITSLMKKGYIKVNYDMSREYQKREITVL